MGRSATLSRRAPVRRMPAPTVPPLENGDHLTRAEFERRYEAMPEGVKAELIEGVVHMSSPMRAEVHGDQTSLIDGWLVLYAAQTPGVCASNNSTVRLDFRNEPQPDLSLRILPGRGGQTSISDGYVVGAPEFLAEVAASPVSIDLHDKLNAYQRNGVREYLVWRVENGALDCFVWREGRYDPLAPDGAGVRRSEVLPGLWLDGPALLRGDMAQVFCVLQEGLASSEHQEFGVRLALSGQPHVE